MLHNVTRLPQRRSSRVLYTWKMESISEGHMVLVQRDKTYRTFVLKKGRKINLEKLSFYPDNALGYSYGSSFQIEKHQLVPVSGAGRWKFGVGGDLVSGSDNRDIMDDGASQELTEETITEMKGQGATGQEIVDSMIEHSSTFKVRTKFSQEKYIKKKERKYIPVIRILRTTTKLLCEMYHERAPSKTCFLRFDSLAQILSLSNVHAHSNMLVMETTQGLLSGAMLERMGGHGKLIQLFYGDFPVRNILESFGHLSESDKSILMKYPFHRVGSLLSREEAESSSVVKEALASKAAGEKEGGCKMELVRAETDAGGEIHIEEDAETSQERASEMEESTNTTSSQTETATSQAEDCETTVINNIGDKCEINPERPIDNFKSPVLPQGDSSAVQNVDSSNSAESAVSLENVLAPESYVKQLVWRGKLALGGIKTFKVQAFAVSGRTEGLSEVLPSTVKLSHRAPIKSIWNYVDRRRNSKSKEIVLIHFEPNSQQSHSADSYTAFFNYHASRDRGGLVGNCSCDVKCLYILPLHESSTIPSQLFPLNGPGLPPNHSNILLGIIIRRKSKSLSNDYNIIAVSGPSECPTEEDYEDTKQDEEKIQANVKFLFDSAVSLSNSPAMLTKSHSHTQDSVPDSNTLSPCTTTAADCSEEVIVDNIVSLCGTESCISSRSSILADKCDSSRVNSPSLKPHPHQQSSTCCEEGMCMRVTIDPEQDKSCPCNRTTSTLQPDERNTCNDADFSESKCCVHTSSVDSLETTIPILCTNMDVHTVDDEKVKASHHNSLDMQHQKTGEHIIVTTQDTVTLQGKDVVCVNSSKDVSTDKNQKDDSAEACTTAEVAVKDLEEDIQPPSKRAKLQGTDVDAKEGTHSQGNESEATEHAQIPVAMDTDTPDKGCKGQDHHMGERIQRKRAKEEAYREAEDLLRQREMDGLVVVSRFHPEPVLMSLIHFVAPSRPVVIYSNILEPLVQCYKSLKESGCTFSIQISETWTRHYQVLPERTHPEMSMDGRSGYILFTTKISKQAMI